MGVPVIIYYGIIYYGFAVDMFYLFLYRKSEC